jgi:anti-sigma B factor antagonist
MTIQSERLSKSSMVLFLNGRLDTATAPLLERKIKQLGDDIIELILDFAGINYISSMGLRVLLQTHKTMLAQNRKLIVKNMSESIREVFEMTGFINLMVQEEKFVVIRKGDAAHIRLCLIGALDVVNLSVLSEELTLIKDENAANERTRVEVILDAQQLASVSVAGCKLLNELIEKTAWEKRTLSIQNASGKVTEIFTSEGLDSLLA